MYTLCCSLLGLNTGQLVTSYRYNPAAPKQFPQHRTSGPGQIFPPANLPSYPGLEQVLVWSPVCCTLLAAGLLDHTGPVHQPHRAGAAGGEEQQVVLVPGGTSVL